MDHHNYFAAVEPIFWKYNGRPHWGKLHTLNARQLRTLYPRWQEFIEVRQALDPAGKFLNAHLSSILGVS
jgi:FAD/FMN-containing dehydrogenase